MAVVNLPDSPANGTTQTVGGITYTYNSSKGYWTAAASGGGGGGGASVTTDDSAPGSPSDGDLWYDTDDGGMFVYYEDADSSQWVEVIGSQGAAGAPGAAGAAGADGGAGVASVYATVDNLPTSGNSQGDMAHVTANNTLYFWNGSGWYKIALINTNPSISGVSSSYALAIDGTATTVTMTATDPEGLPITYSIASDTSGNTATVAQGSGASSNVFTITPSTNTAYAGSFTLTFRASDGVNLATAPATFTLQFSVENSNYTTALITSVGANNAVNNSFDDKSTSDHTITVGGNAHQTTFSPYRHGGYSTYFDGSGDYLTVADHADLSMGTGDFTIEMWVYPTTSNNGQSLITKGSNSTYTPYLFMLYGTDLRFLSSSNGSSYDIANKSVGTVTINAWNHIAMVKSGTSYTTYVNGTQSDTFTSSSNPHTNTQAVGIGGANNGTELFAGGYITDVRIIKGTAVTPSSGGPTERLTAVTNTELLACHLPYFADGSTNSHSITVNGNTKTEPFAPYDEQEYSASSHGGSVSFDGSSDYIQAPAASVARGTGDWTIECWAYFHSLGSTSIIWDARTGATPTDDFLSVQSDGSFRYRSNGITTSSTGLVKAGRWHHIAQVLNSGTLKTYLDGTQVTSNSQTSNLSLGATFTIGGSVHDNGQWSNANFADFRVVLGTAVYTSAFTPPTAPLTAISGTSLLLKGTDAGIIDKSQSVKTINLSGDTKSSTTQSKYLTSSIKFDGNDYMTMPDIELGSSDYTVECWAWISAQGGTAGIFSKGSPGGLTAATWSLEFSSSNNYVALYIYAANSGAYVITGSTNIITSSWNHIAVTRSGNETKLFINGTQDGSTYTNNYTVGTGGDFYLGGGFYAPTSRTITGYMSDFRVTKGLARYTSNFTAPTAALQG